MNKPGSHPRLLGILLKLAAVVLFSAMAVGVKYLGREVPAGQTLFVRSLIAVLSLVGLTWWRGQKQLLRTTNWRSHALRSSFGAVSMFAWFVALGRAPIADVTAVMYVAPIFVTLLAPPFLGESIRGYRWLAVLIGFAGTFIMISPYLSFAGASLGIVLALGSALFSALAMLFLRKLSATEHPITITFYFSLTTLSGAAISALWGWPMLNATQWAIVIVVGALGTGAQLLMTAAYRYAEDTRAHDVGGRAAGDRRGPVDRVVRIPPEDATTLSAVAVCQSLTTLLQRFESIARLH